MVLDFYSVFEYASVGGFGPMLGFEILTGERSFVRGMNRGYFF